MFLNQLRENNPHCLNQQDDQVHQKVVYVIHKMKIVLIVANVPAAALVVYGRLLLLLFGFGELLKSQINLWRLGWIGKVIRLNVNWLYKLSTFVH